MDKEDDKEIFEEEENIVSFFRRSPLYGIVLDLTRDESPVPDDFLDKAERENKAEDRDPFEGWEE